MTFPKFLCNVDKLQNNENIDIRSKYGAGMLTYVFYSYLIHSSKAQFHQPIAIARPRPSPSLKKYQMCTLHRNVLCLLMPPPPTITKNYCSTFVLILLYFATPQLYILYYRFSFIHPEPKTKKTHSHLIQTTRVWHTTHRFFYIIKGVRELIYQNIFLILITELLYYCSLNTVLYNNIFSME